MRIFVAVDLPQAVLIELASLQQQLRLVTNTARWVAPGSLHVTLKFIGEVSEQKGKEIDSALHQVTGKPFVLSITGTGFFPNSRSPRVFWVGVDGAPLAALAEEIESRMEKLGLPREKRPFQPHLTLARSRGERMGLSIVDAAKGFGTKDFGSFVVDRFFLYQSTLRPEGAIYQKLNEYRLAEGD